MFNLFVLTVNLNLYCSSEALEIRANHLYCMCLTSVNHAHCGFRAKWSRAIVKHIVRILATSFPVKLEFKNKSKRNNGTITFS